MRLLQLHGNGQFSLAEFYGKNIPQYAILSHTWGKDSEEVIFRDIEEGIGKEKDIGHEKLIFCGKQALRDGLKYFWVDTCCIDKSSSAELSEAINSMFNWYQRAAKCYVYLSDVSVKRNRVSNQGWQPEFKKSRWFTRGWTLQELIAPESVEFFSKEGNLLGDKNSMVEEISTITGIRVQALQGKHIFQLSFEERMSWAKERDTKRDEDFAYSLLGLLDINMPPIYGEGRKKALRRLQNEFCSSKSSPSPNMAKSLKHQGPYKGTKLGKVADRLAHKRLLCRFYEPLVLLYTLGSIEEEHTITVVPTEADIFYLSRRTLRRNFLDDLAYICDYGNGDSTVTAIGLESLPQDHVLWISSSSSPSKLTIDFVESLLARVKEHLRTNDNAMSRRREEMIRMCIEFAAPRIKKDRSCLLSSLQTCVEQLGTTIQKGQSPRSICTPMLASLVQLLIFFN
jgi:hypothetical protein